MGAPSWPYMPVPAPSPAGKEGTKPQPRAHLQRGPPPLHALLIPLSTPLVQTPVNVLMRTARKELINCINQLPHLTDEQNEAGASLDIQCLGLCASTARATDSICGLGTKIPHIAAAWPNKNEKRKRKNGAVACHKPRAHLISGLSCLTPATFTLHGEAKNDKEGCWEVALLSGFLQAQACPSFLYLPPPLSPGDGCVF